VLTPLDGDESTVLTESAELEAETELTSTGQSLPFIQRFNVRMIIGSIAAVVALISGVALMIERREAAAPVAVKPRPAISQAAVIAQPTGRVAIHAFPWANVTNIRDLNSGKDMAVELVTPAPVDLAPGRYEVTFSNPNFRKPITRTVDVAAGRDEMLSVQFTNPESASLPQFGGAR
jgi:hypothetical protein